MFEPLTDLDLQVNRGEVFGLLGPNGSGKSTSIKMILGLLYPTAGNIAVFGKRPDDVATKRLIGYLPEDTNLYPFLNARETLDYYGRLFGQDRRQRMRRIDMLLEMVGLAAAQRRRLVSTPRGCSDGSVWPVRLINDPQLLVLDEPTNGLDPIGTRQIKDLILELSQRGRRSCCVRTCWPMSRMFVIALPLCLVERSGPSDRSTNYWFGRTPR